MSKNNENLSRILNDLTLLLERIDKSPEQIEIDIALSHTRDLYNSLLHLKPKAESEIPQDQPQEVQKQEIKDTSEFRTLQNSDIQKEKLVVEKEIIETSSITVTTKDIEPIKELEDELVKPIEQPVQQVQEVTVTKHEVVREVSAKVSESDILAEKFKRNEPLINEILARVGKRDISSLLQSKPIKNIEAAIGINERFEFVRELFNGDNATYLKTIRVLDSSSNFNEAFNYINQTFSWDYENETVHKLLDLVRRRYITDTK